MFVLLHHTKKPQHHIKLKLLWPNCKIDITCNTESKKKNKNCHHIIIILQGKRHDSCILLADVFARYELIMSTERAAFYADKYK